MALVETQQRQRLENLKCLIFIIIYIALKQGLRSNHYIIYVCQVVRIYDCALAFITANSD